MLSVLTKNADHQAGIHYRDLCDYNEARFILLMTFLPSGV